MTTNDSNTSSHNNKKKHQQEPIDMEQILMMVEDMSESEERGGRGFWSCGFLNEQVREITRRTLAIALIKLVSVFTSQLGPVCICTLSNHPEVLANALSRLSEGEQVDRANPIELPPIDQQQFMKWVHGQIRAGNLKGPEWEGLDRQYRVTDYLLSIQDAFDLSIDKMMSSSNNDHPYSIADDVIAMLEWLGGVRTFDVAMRLCLSTVEAEGLGSDSEEEEEDEDEDEENGGKGGKVTEPSSLSDEVLLPKDGPLESWKRMVDLSVSVREKGGKLDKQLAEEEKQKGNQLFASGQFSEALLCFSTASLINPSDPTYWTNSAAARIKLGTDTQMSQAVDDCTIALELDSRNLKAYYRRAVALDHLDIFEVAVADLKSLLRIQPDNQPARSLLQHVKSRAKKMGIPV